MNTNSYKEDGRPADQWYWDDWFSAFDVRLCSLAARGLWIDMLGIMFKAEIRGTLTINGKQVDSKKLAKIAGDTIAKIKDLLQELEEQNVFSRLEDNTVVCRRMFRQSGKQDQISQIRSIAGKKGADARWQTDGKPMAKMAASSPSPSSTSPTKKEEKEEGPLPQHKRIKFSFKSKEWQGILIEDKSQWKAGCPDVDIEKQLYKMKNWLIANPNKAKKNYAQFIVNWLNSEQGKIDAKNRYSETDKKEIDDWVKEPVKEGEK